MLKHIVMWKLLKEAEGGDALANARKMKSLLEALRGKVAGMKTLEVGLDIERSSTAYDVVLYSEFESKEALASYQKHPEHVLAGTFIGKVKESRVVVDYEV